MAALVFSGLSINLVFYAIGHIRNDETEDVAPVAIQFLSDKIAAQAGINSVKVVVRHGKQFIAYVQCKDDKPKCIIYIDDETVSRMPDQAPAIAGIIAHEIGHIIKPPPSIEIYRLVVFLSINFVLLIYVYLMGWKPALAIFALFEASFVIISIYSGESVGGFMSGLLNGLLVLGMVIWPVQLKSRIIFCVAVLVVLLPASEVMKYQLRQNEASADLFALKIVGKPAVTQTLCLLREKTEVMRGNLGSILSMHLERDDPHPSIENRFAITKISENDCLIHSGLGQLYK